MMKKNNKTCICCGVKYTFCPNCSDYNHLPRWMNLYHDENCKSLFNITSCYINGIYSKDKAKEMLMKCDLSKKNEIVENIKNYIDEIMEEEKLLNKEEISVETEDIPNEIAETLKNEEIKLPKKNNVSRRKHYKKQNTDEQ